MNRYVKLPESRFVELFDAERKCKALGERLEAMSCEKVPENMDVGVPEESEAFALADATVHAMDARIRELEAQLADKSRLLSEAKDDAVRFRKGRDDRQAERDRERSRVRLLNTEIARLRSELRASNALCESAIGIIEKILCLVKSTTPFGSYGDALDSISALCSGYMNSHGLSKHKANDENE